MVGNDIVDLRDADSRPESFRPRFDARVFEASERDAIARDARPLARRWAQWAAKEAAYKLARRVDPEFVFRPRALVVTLEEDGGSARDGRLERRGRVSVRVGTGGEVSSALPPIEILSIETEERVHVVAFAEGGDRGVMRGVASLADPERDDPSLAVRRLARRGLAARMGIAEDRLGIGRRGRIPTLELDGDEVPIFLSLSHHGRYVAYAAARAVEIPSRTEAPRPGDGAGPWPTT